MSEEGKWDLVIDQKRNPFSINLHGIKRYKDLLFLFVKRDIVVQYKQTILGPLWFIIQPVLTTIVFTIIFGQLGKIGPDNIPHIPFYMVGIILWNYFSDCILKTSETFITNQSLFSKVFFPRLIVPISILISNSFKFLIQFALFLCIYIYYAYKGALDLSHLANIWILPFVLLIVSFMSLGLGILVASMTVKYRDLKFLIQFAVQLLMYASPIVIPLSIAGSKKWIILLNPMSSMIEAMRNIFLNAGELNLMYILYSVVFTLVVLFIGILYFNKTEKSFIDTV